LKIIDFLVHFRQEKMYRAMNLCSVSWWFWDCFANANITETKL